MKYTKSLFILLVLAMFTMTSCYEEELWLDDNITGTGNHVPFIQNLSVTNTPESGTFQESDIAMIALQYWSIDAVKSLDVYATIGETETLDKSHAYIDSYDDVSDAQLQTVEYVVPAGTSGSSISLRVVVVTDAGLTREKTTSITVE